MSQNLDSRNESSGIAQENAVKEDDRGEKRDNIFQDSQRKTMQSGSNQETADLDPGSHENSKVQRSDSFRKFFFQDPPKKHSTVIMGSNEMSASSSFPIRGDRTYQGLEKIYVCENCLEFFKCSENYNLHVKKCDFKHPPGEKIYAKNSILIYEVKGSKSKRYCTNLCVLGKLFLDIKCVVDKLSKFLFYILTVEDKESIHIIGFFSKQKEASMYNLNCLVILPPYQKKGYGQLLIDLSYLLSKIEGKVGSPERPFSDLGQAAYEKYWKRVLVEYLNAQEKLEISVEEMSKETAIAANDILNTLKAMDLIEDMKKSKITVKELNFIDYAAKAIKRESEKVIDKECLKWQPHI